MSLLNVECLVLKKKILYREIDFICWVFEPLVDSATERISFNLLRPLRDPPTRKDALKGCDKGDELTPLFFHNHNIECMTFLSHLTQ